MELERYGEFENKKSFESIRCFDKAIYDSTGLRLSLYEKIFLTSDGTVTDLLSVYTNTDIQVVKILQEPDYSLAKEHPFCPVNSQILKRSILLGNQIQNYIYAESIFVMDSFPAIIKSKLIETNCPIGQIWNNEKIETFREIIEYKLETNAVVSNYLNLDTDTKLISRSYYVYSNNKMLAMITEKFPINFF